MAMVSVVIAAESDVQLKEVVVTATKTERSAQDITQSVTVITADELQHSSATTVAEAVKTATSVDIREYGSRGATSTISLRGAGYQQVLVLLDGKRMNSASSGGFDLSTLAVPLDSIERIEILRGPASALYGADAVGGVVNIITKKPTETTVSITGSAGPHAFTSLGAGLSGRADSIYYVLSAGKERSHGNLDNNAYDRLNAGIKLGYDLDTTSSLEATMDYLDKDLGVPGPSSYPTPLAQQTDKDLVLGLAYKAQFSKELNASVNVYQTEGKIAYQNPDPFFPEDSNHRSVTSGAEARVSWLANSWNLFTLGTEAREDQMVSSDAGDHTASLSAVYLQDEISMSDVFILVLGGRNDSHSVYGDQFSPKASLRILDSSTNTIVRASWGKSFRAPTLNDLYWPDTSWAVGNPDLRPETAEEYEAGIEQSLGNGSMIKFTTFDRKVTDLIEWQPDASYKYSPVNIGEAHISGYEAEAKFVFSDTVTFAINYTEIDPVNEQTGEKIYYSIPHVQIGGSLYLALAKETSLSLDGRRVTNYVKPDEEKWDYYTVDGKITETFYSGEGKKGDIFIGMKNMFNRKYEAVKGYPMPTAEVYGGVALQF